MSLVVRQSHPSFLRRHLIFAILQTKIRVLFSAPLLTLRKDDYIFNIKFVNVSQLIRLTAGTDVNSNLIHVKLYT